mmetsp:Transcript_44796/g.111338  ORF Transcript_44796/g.111338 Transcript_44796/m.111338 type:complete len:104 (-) Transcript_44796:71-382(-)
MRTPVELTTNEGVYGRVVHTHESTHSVTHSHHTRERSPVQPASHQSRGTSTPAPHIMSAAVIHTRRRPSVCVTTDGIRAMQGGRQGAGEETCPAIPSLHAFMH